MQWIYYCSNVSTYQQLFEQREFKWITHIPYQWPQKIYVWRPKNRPIYHWWKLECCTLFGIIICISIYKYNEYWVKITITISAHLLIWASSYTNFTLNSKVWLNSFFFVNFANFLFSSFGYEIDNIYLSTNTNLK